MSEARISIEALRESNTVLHHDSDRVVYPGRRYRWEHAVDRCRLCALMAAVEALNEIADRASYAKSTDDLSDVWRTFMAITDARADVLARFDFGEAA